MMQKEYCKRCSLPLREWEWSGRGLCEMCEDSMPWTYLPGEVVDSCSWTKDGWRFCPPGYNATLFDDELEMIANACRHFGYGGIEDAVDSMRRL